MLIYLNFFIVRHQNYLRWKVRLFDGTENSKEGWVPADILDTQNTEQAIYGEKADDAAYRRE